MLNSNIRPSTIGGIKRLAKQIKKSDGLPHHEALDIAAQKASFENFRHAQNQLENSTTQSHAHRLFFSSYWYDRKKRRIGREVLEIQLSMPLLKIASKHEFKYAANIGQLRLASPDHFVDDRVADSQSQSRERICKAVRTLRFIEAAGLKPNRKYEQFYPDGNFQNKPPQLDHSSNWYDPATGQAVLVDEPYLPAVVDGDRAEWAEVHNWHLQPSTWPGIYYPGMSCLFVATDATTDFDFVGLMNKINSIPDPITIKTWDGESFNGHDTFYSPLCVTEQDKKRAVAKGTIYRTSSKKTIPISTWGTPDNERRPNAAMPIKAHQRAAKLINAVLHSNAKPYDVNMRLEFIRNKLENWFFSEYERSVTDEFELFYYEGIEKNDPLVKQAASEEGVSSLLQELRRILLDSYVDCEPVRKMIRRIDTSIKIFNAT